LKERDEFRKKVGLNNIYFSEEMENALRLYGFNTEIIPLYYRKSIVGIITNYTKKHKISLPPYLFPFYGLHINNDFLTEHPEKAIETLRLATENQKRKFIYSLFSLSPEITDIRAFKESGWRESVKYTYRILRNEIKEPYTDSTIVKEYVLPPHLSSEINLAVIFLQTQ